MYNTVNYMFFTKPYKILPFSRLQNYSQKNNINSTSGMFDTKNSSVNLETRLHFRRTLRVSYQAGSKLTDTYRKMLYGTTLRISTRIFSA